MKKAIVIGAGIGGLAVAVRLSVKGFQVDLYDKNESVGGKLAELKSDGFRFDIGPSLFTMPHYLEDLFHIAGKSMADYLRYKKLDYSCQYFFADGSNFVFYNDKTRLELEVQQKLRNHTLLVTDYLEESEKLFNGAGKLFIENSLHKFKTFWSRQALKALPQLINPKNLMSLHSKNKTYFKDKKWVQLFDRYATYNGSSPYKTPSMMSVIPHLEHNIGTFFPEGGMRGIVKALEKLALEQGVNILTNKKVTKLNTDNGKVISAVIDQNTINADVFVSNMDVALFYDKLLNDSNKFKTENRKARSSSALVFYWGINACFPYLKLHNIFFSSDYKAEFKSIFELQENAEMPTIYLNISSKCQPVDAPEGKENWFVMINMPSGIKLTKNQIQKVRTVVLDILTDRLEAKIEDEIIFEEILTPDDIEDRTYAMKGALYGAASNSVLSSFTRHSNFSKDFSNLYFVGGTVHPGGGIPLCLNSAKIVADHL